jgi:hypothetical protein
LKQVFAAILFIAFAVQSFDKLFILVDYYGNTAAYAKNCENKDKPMMHCNGKCQMAKKLQQEENKDKQNPNRRADNKDEVLLSAKSFFATVPPSWQQPYKINYPFLFDGKEIKMPRSIFHPPLV